ncbi:phage tail length tape measure family protein [Bradyrhizobium sp. PMVTL-01]|uniref:phage tail length tape measure family protein n=1 Tax=Bradyrhizobium sp. PMVTL-01 TaxID=3434999 RepID=UPI003F71E2AE
MTDTVDKVIIQSSSEGTDQVTAELQGLAKAYDGVTVASQSTERSTTSVESKFAALERRSGTTAGQLAQFEKIQRDVNLAVSQNPALLERGNAVLAAAEQRYGAVSQALQKQRNEMERLAAVQKTINSTTGVVGLSDSAARAADIAAYGAALDGLRAKYDPLFAAGQKYASVLAEIADAERVGAISAQTATKARLDQTASYNTQIANLERVAQLQKQAAQAAVNSQTIVPDRGADIAAYGKQLDDLRAKYNPLFAAGQQYKATLAEISQAAKVGALTEVEAAAAITRTKSAFVEKVASLKQDTSAMEENAHAAAAVSQQGQSLFHAVRGGIEQVAAGAPLLQAVTQQMNHLAYASTGKDGLAGAFGEAATLAQRVVTSVVSMINPLTLTIAGVATLTAGFVAMSVAAERAQKAASLSLIGAGARSGTTIADQNNFVAQNSSDLVTQKEMRALAEAATATGEITISQLHNMGDAMAGFATKTGVSMDDARKATLGFMLDPRKALLELGTTFGDFDNATVKAVDSLVQAGDKTKAFQTIIDALDPKLKESIDTMGAWERTWSRIKAGAANAVSTKPVGVEDQIDAVKKSLNAAITSAANGNADAAPYVAALSREWERLQAQLDKKSAEGAAERINHLSAEVLAIDKGTIPAIEQIQKLQTEINKLEEAKAAGAVSAQGRSVDDDVLTAKRNLLALTQQQQEAEARNQQIVAAVSKEWAGVGQQTAMSLQAQQNMLPVASAVGGAARIAAQEAADYANAMLNSKSATEASEIALMNMRQALAQVNAAAKETLWNLQNQAPVAAAVTEQQKMQAQAQATANQLKHDGVDATIAEQVAAQQLANSQAQATASVKQQVEALKDSTAMIKAQQNGTEAETAAAIAYKNAIQAGADATAAASLKAATLANYMEKAAASGELLKQAISQYASTGGLISNGGTQGLQAMNAVDNSGGSSNGFSNPGYLSTINFTPNVMPKGPLTFSGFVTRFGGPDIGNGGHIDQGANPAYYQMLADAQAKSIDFNAAYATGGIQGALDAIKNAPNTTGADPNYVSNSLADQAQMKFYLGPQTSQVSTKISAYDQLIQLMNAQTSDKSAQAANLQNELGFLNTLPGSVERDQKIADVQQAIQQLTTAIDNNTQATNANSELLSPYYTQDPRTSHIGFRSQGMASTGYIDIPGVPSANDNMTLTLPVASGERVNVTNGPNRGGGSPQISFGNIIIQIQGNASSDDANAIGRTVYQQMQRQARQLAGAR